MKNFRECESKIQFKHNRNKNIECDPTLDINLRINSIIITIIDFLNSINRVCKQYQKLESQNYLTFNKH